MKPIWKDEYNKWFCPQCGDVLKITTVKYNKINDGVFKSDKMIIETTYTSKRCGWSYTKKETE